MAPLPLVHHTQNSLAHLSKLQGLDGGFLLGDFGLTLVQYSAVGTASSAPGNADLRCQGFDEIFLGACNLALV